MPAAFLLAVTVALLLVRSAVRDEEPASSRATTTVGTTTVEQSSTRRPVPTTPRQSTAGQQFYEIQSGDTLGTVAERHETTVESLVGLNAGIDPTALQVGERIRVK